ncbi:MAG: GNAT family N-acetyltransferase [Promethearchaeota archaeon]
MFNVPTIYLSNDPLIILRQAKPTDLDFIKEVSHSEMDKVVPQSWNWDSWFNDLNKFINGNYSHKVFIIEVEAASAGYIWLNEELNSLWLTAIVLSSPYQRQRVGEKIMNYLSEETRKEGKKSIELGVQHDNAKALRFYTKLGFVKFDHIKSVNTDLFRLDLK